MGNVKRHDKFYFIDGNLVLKVEDVLFRVVKSVMIRHSTVFADILTPVESEASGAAGCDAEGLSDDKPIFLEGIKCVDFEALLSFMFPFELGREFQKIYYTEEQCTGALELATRWEIRSLLPIITEHLCKHDFAGRPDFLFELATVHELKHEKIFDAITTICRRKTFFDVATARRLGLDATVKVAQLQVEGFDKARCIRSFGYDDLLERPAFDDFADASWSSSDIISHRGRGGRGAVPTRGAPLRGVRGVRGGRGAFALAEDLF